MSARRWQISLTVLAVALVWPAESRAEIKTKVRADGTLVVYNDDPPRAAAPRLREPRDPGWDAWIQTHARANDLDPKLVRAVIQIESAYDARAVSRKGAQGLMQLMPATARELQVSNAFDPEQNIRGGTRYLRQMLDEFSRLELALAAYNAGPGAVREHRGIPPYRETRDYVRKVLTLYRGVAPELPQAPETERRGRRVFLRVGPDNQIVMTTAPAGK